MHKSFGFAFYLVEFGAYEKLTEYASRLPIRALQKPSVVELSSHGALSKGRRS